MLMKWVRNMARTDNINSPATLYDNKEESKDVMVCVNECCAVYCRESCIKFMYDFKHCPYCAGKLVTEGYAMLLLKKVRK